MRRGEKKFSKAAEVVLESLFVEGNAGKAQEIVLEVVQIPGNRLAIEAGARDSRPCSSGPGRLRFESAGGWRQPSDTPRGAGDDEVSIAMFVEEFEQA